MPSSDQKIEALNGEDIARLVSQRAVVEKYLGNDPGNLSKYQTAAGKLGLLRALLQGNVFKPTQTYELQCMGIVLGDVFVQELGLEWRAVEDEFGRDPCVQLRDTTIVVFPLTMISKRIEKGEHVDVFYLFNRMAHEIELLKDKADKITN
jgi:hypothetical protein